jgi:hypothetical protein
VHPVALLEGKGSENKTRGGVGERIRGMEKRRKGRPRKKEDSIEFWQFARAGKVMSAYDEARKKGEKHSVAVREAVDSLRLGSPEMRISETGVKHILSTFRPRGSGTILLFERSPLSEEDIKRHRWIREQFAAVQKEKDITLQVPPVNDETRRREKFTIRFSERPNYPRHNRKS